MRQFATTMNITDLQGYPITGDRLAFFVDGTETLATIYDANENAIQNPVKIVNGHTEKQVFLPNTDIRIVQQTLVDEEEDYWEPVATWVDKPGQYNVNVVGGIPSVKTVAALRTTDVNVGTVILLGYNAEGDKPQLTYVWDSASTATDDNGMVIASSNETTGRWKALIESEYIDIRHYGIFPKVTRETAQGVAIASAYNSVRGLKKNLYFPVVGNAVNYEIGGCNIFNALFDNDALVFTLGNNAVLDGCKNVHAYGTSAGTIGIYGDELNTNQNTLGNSYVNLHPRSQITLSSDYGLDSSWEGVHVIVLATVQRTMHFKNCTFGGTNKFKGVSSLIYFDSCNVRQSMFDGDFEYFDFTNCESDADLWSDVYKYVQFCQNNGSAVIDLNGKTYIDPTITGPVSIRNGVLSGTATITTGNITLENVTVNRLAGSSIGVFTAINSVIGGTGTLSCTEVKCVNSQFNVVATCDKFVANNSQISYQVTAKHYNVNNCTISQNMNLTAVNSNVSDVNFLGNVFTGTSCINFTSSNTGFSIENFFVVNNIVNGTRRFIFEGQSKFSTFENFVVSNNVNALSISEASGSLINTFSTISTKNIVSDSSYLSSVGKLAMKYYEVLEIDHKESQLIEQGYNFSIGEVVLAKMPNDGYDVHYIRAYNTTVSTFETATIPYGSWVLLVFGGGDRPWQAIMPINT